MLSNVPSNSISVQITRFIFNSERTLPSACSIRFTVVLFVFRTPAGIANNSLAWEPPSLSTFIRKSSSGPFKSADSLPATWLPRNILTKSPHKDIDTATKNILQKDRHNLVLGSVYRLKIPHSRIQTACGTYRRWYWDPQSGHFSSGAFNKLK